MDLMNFLSTKLVVLIPMLTTLVVVVGGLALVNWILRRRWQNQPDAQFRFQLIMLALSFAGLLALLVALPIDEETRGQLLSLIGILLSAAIALSSTTFIGNMMAGIMLRAIKGARPGDFITVAELTGRITEMGLLHTEVQTEFRDLVTVPNLYMVTQPMQVVRASGTIIAAEVSLGYEVSHAEISKILCEAAARSGLKDSFMHVRELGDFSVTYRVAGLLEDVKSLISARSRLRESMLDALHEAGIEIVSPNFMNTRPIAEGKSFIPAPARGPVQQTSSQAENIAFDKAEEAASVEEIRKSVELVEAELASLKDKAGEEDAESREKLESRHSHLLEQLKKAEEERQAAEQQEQ